LNYSIKPLISPINTTIEIPGSKSITNRALLLAALAKGRSTLSGVLFSDDTLVFLNALKVLGVKLTISVENKTVIIEGIDGKFPQKEAEINCGDAGTAARFLLAVCAMNAGEFNFDGSTRLRDRPLLDLIKILKQQGAVFSPEKNMPFTIKGSTDLLGGDIFVPGDESSQFLSALLMISPYLKSDVALTTSHVISRPYIDMTCSMMKTFGVCVNSQENTWRIRTPQHYQSQHYLIEPDLSTASYFFAAAALTGGKIKIPNISRKKCLQGDIAFLSVLELMGSIIEEEANAIILQGPKKLKGVECINMGDISDTFITLACLAPFADSPTTITHIAHTRFQESDRIEAVSKNLIHLGIYVESGKDFIRIYPGVIQAGVVETYSDHRIAMAFSLIGLKVLGITIKNIECVSKTCPDFIRMLESCSNLPPHSSQG
jgi:3-phosphoshikimate 1-carboxyvinyltransferase